VRSAAALAACQIWSCPRNCRRRVRLQRATGLCGCKAWEGGDGPRPASQETCLNTSSFRRAGRAHGAVVRCDDTSVVTRMEGPPCDIVCAIFPIHAALAAASLVRCGPLPPVARLGLSAEPPDRAPRPAVRLDRLNRTAWQNCIYSRQRGIHPRFSLSICMVGRVFLEFSLGRGEP